MKDIQLKVGGTTSMLRGADLDFALLYACLMANQARQICYVLIDGNETVRVRPNRAYLEDARYQQLAAVVMDLMNEEDRKLTHKGAKK